MERIVVFGGLDFIGYHVCCYMIEQGIETIIVDAGSTNDLQNSRFDHIGRNALIERVSRSSGETINILEPVDLVYFMYRPYSPSEIEADYRKLLEFQMAELKTAIEFTRIKKAKLILLTSSIPPENTSEMKNFDKLKRELESYVKQEGNKFEYYAIVRIPLVFGPWCERQCTIQGLIKKKMAKEQITSQELDIEVVYIDDLIQGLYQLSVKKQTNEVVIYKGNNTPVQLATLHKWFGIRSGKSVNEALDEHLIEALDKTATYVQNQVVKE